MNDLADRLLDAFLGSHPAQAATAMARMEPSAAGAILDLVSPISAARTMAETPVRDRRRILAAMRPARLGRVLALMPPDAAVSLVAWLDETRREQALGSLPEREARSFRRQLEFPAGTVGHGMEPAHNVIHQGASPDGAREVLAHEGGAYVYVVDPRGVLVGVVARQDLQREGAAVDDVMVRDFHSVPPATSLEQAGELEAWTEVDMLPVVDQAGILVGRLRHKQLRRWAESAAAMQPRAVYGGLDPFVGLTETYCSRLWEVVAALAEMSTPEPDPAHEERES